MQKINQIAFKLPECSIWFVLNLFGRFLVLFYSLGSLFSLLSRRVMKFHHFFLFTPEKSQLAFQLKRKRGRELINVSFIRTSRQVVSNKSSFVACRNDPEEGYSTNRSSLVEMSPHSFLPSAIAVCVCVWLFHEFGGICWFLFCVVLKHGDILIVVYSSLHIFALLEDECSIFSFSVLLYRG